MAVVDVIETVKSSITFEAEDYVIKTNDKHLFKFYHKIRSLPEENVREEVKKFVTDKMKNKNSYWLEEIQLRNIEMLINSIIEYFTEYTSLYGYEEVEDKTTVKKTYQFKEMSNDEEDVENENSNL